MSSQIMEYHQHHTLSLQGVDDSCTNHIGVNSSLASSLPSKVLRPRMDLPTAGAVAGATRPVITAPVLPPDISPCLPRFPCPPGLELAPGIIEIGRSALDEIATSLHTQIWIRNLVGQGALLLWGEDFVDRKFVVGIRFALNNQEVLDVGVRAAKRRALHGNVRRIDILLPGVEEIDTYARDIENQLWQVFPGVEANSRFYKFDRTFPRSSSPRARTKFRVCEVKATPSEISTGPKYITRRVRIPRDHRSGSMSSGLGEITEEQEEEEDEEDEEGEEQEQEQEEEQEGDGKEEKEERDWIEELCLA